MKKGMSVTVASALLTIGTIVASHAQNLVQPLSVNLVAYDTATARTVRIGTPQLIRHFTGSNVLGGHLYLVTPGGNAPGSTGNLNAFLRITKGSETLLEITSPDQFNLYQDFAAVKGSSSHALNRFSIDSGSVRAELQGVSTWTLSQGGTGPFHSSVNGWIAIFNVTELNGVPVKGTISAGFPRSER